jgi:hypothetical protein
MAGTFYRRHEAIHVINILRRSCGYVPARGVFTSVPDLKRKLMRYIREYNKEPRTVKWKYFDPTRRVNRYSPLASDVARSGAPKEK